MPSMVRFSALSSVRGWDGESSAAAVCSSEASKMSACTLQNRLISSGETPSSMRDCSMVVTSVDVRVPTSRCTRAFASSALNPACRSRMMPATSFRFFWSMVFLSRVRLYASPVKLPTHGLRVIDPGQVPV